MGSIVKLPAGWVSTIVKDLCFLINGRAFKPAEWEKEGRPIIRIQNLNNPEAPFNYHNGDIDPKFHVSTNDLLFAWSGTPGTSFGAHVWNGPDAYLNQHIFKVLFDENSIDKLFFKLALNNRLENIISRAQGGVGLRHITKGKFEQTEIYLPPLNEQRRISARINTLQAKSNKAKQALEAAKPLLNKLRQSILASAFRGDLTAQWRKQNPNIEPASKLLERIRIERRQKWEAKELEKMRAKGKEPKNDKWKAKYKEPEPVDTSELPELPEGWRWASVDILASMVTDGEHQTPPRSNKGKYLLSARNIQNGYISYEKVDYVTDEVHDRLKRRLSVKAGDVLMSCSGTLGRTCVVQDGDDFSMVRSVALIRPVEKMGDYFSLAIRSPLLQNQINQKKTQTAQSNIFQGKIKTLLLPIPNLDEQKKIIEILTNNLQKINCLEKFICTSNVRLKELDQAILTKAFRGELVPQDPNDEPASLLLERIKAKREAIKPKRKTRKKTK